MAKKFIHKKSYTASEVPVPADLKRGELAINLADKTIYSKDDNDAIVDLTANADTVDGVHANAIIFGNNGSGTTLELVDWDDLVKSGFYSVGPAALNLPYASNWGWGIHHEHKDLNGYGFQLAGANAATPRLSMRTKQNYIYSSWVEFMKTTDTAADSSKLNGYVSSTGTTVDTIARRDTNGYLYAVHLYMSHAATDRTSDTVFFSTTDGFIRRNNKASFRTSLDVYSKAEAFTSGSNSDGTYVKHADGTLICTRPSISGSASADTTWTFPLAFNTSSIAVTGNMVGSGSGIRAISFRTPSTTAVDFSIYNSSDARTGDNASLIAIGKWK